VTCAGNIAGGVNNMPAGHLFVWNLEFVIWNLEFPPQGVYPLISWEERKRGSEEAKKNNSLDNFTSS
jgi:hypothetical protein